MDDEIFLDLSLYFVEFYELINAECPLRICDFFHDSRQEKRRMKVGIVEQ